MPIRDPSDGRVDLLRFSGSRAQTPAERRLEAERELTDARGAIHREYGAATWAVAASRPQRP
ncbi:hypothetical protein [Arthrobacter sp. PsM3]|uniref:hypothetical protein n=1 Tax=Arthrobacter sp. PsM3 TaxID=3030531 RepID=UPI00263A824F|nr:hypothetical protein [Arthrobacter sp. PsM3]MDN4646203.1 hypothetical protein [Arthrobacter sp. PsM3]